MPVVRSQRRVPLQRPAGQPRPTALAIALCIVALCTVGFTGGSPRTVPGHDTGALASGPAPRRGLFSLPTTAPISPPSAPSAPGALGTPDAPKTGTVRQAVRAMSMDAPIQGGLTAHQEQAVSARVLHRHLDPEAVPRSAHWSATMGRSAVARARSWLGMPYSWAGGNASGPTPGRCEPGNGGDLDCHVVGFDCSGLMVYAWGPYASLPHLAEAQRDVGGFRPTLDQLRPGDLVFFAGYLPGGTGHVAIYAGDGTVIEAPQSGSVVRSSPLADLMAHDGSYRGAVRPLTTPAPRVADPRRAVPSAGGTVVLHGAHLAGVDMVLVGKVAVRRFGTHSDSTIVFHAPAHAPGPVAVTVSTPWRARSHPATLVYAKPPPAPRKPAPRTPAPRTPAPRSSPAASTTPTTPTTPPAPTTTPTPTPTGSTGPSSGGSTPAG